MSEKIVEVDHVTMNFRLEKNKQTSLKGFVVAAIKRELQYEYFQALHDVSFSLEPGDVLGIIGRNGAGKSTLLKIIAGIMKPTEGSVKIRGNIVPMLELGSGFDQELTGRENIFLNGAILGYSKRYLESKYEEIVEFSELEKFIDMPIRNYSSGMMMRLAFSVATVVKPEILIVDEILAVGDAAFQEKSYARMLEMMGGGTTVFFVSHSLSQVRKMCNKVLWLEHGRAVGFAAAKELCDRYEQAVEEEIIADGEKYGYGGTEGLL